MKRQNFVHNPDTLDCFHPLEHAYLSDFLGVPRPLCALNINPFDPNEIDKSLDEDEHESDGIFRLRPTLEGDFNDNTVPNAIARIALNEHQRTLPQWSCGNSEGFVQARHYEGRTLRRVKLEPLFLLMINYADSGPGFSWPESYHVTFFPHYDVYIVTASQDSPDAHGYTDEAIGFFGKEEDIIEGARPFICDWWTGEIEPSPEYAWQNIFQEGLINAETAFAWRAETFGLDDVEEEEA